MGHLSSWPDHVLANAADEGKLFVYFIHETSWGNLMFEFQILYEKYSVVV